jgi:exodeoxyribonuclease VII small subunit
MTEANAITFESGYRRLQAIAERLNGDEVPVHEMCDLFAEGKGLEHALTAYLDEQKERVEAIEHGQGVQAFRVVAPAGAPAPSPDAEFVVDPPIPATRLNRRSGVPSPAEDDIPF